VLVQDAGRIVARGTHAQLLAESEIYNEILWTQLDADATEPAAV
jgi:ABC-type multidrug transport system fused ATPase/permease subunit